MSDNSSEFRDWMKQVNRLLEARYGVGSDDLPDYCWVDHFDSGITAEEAFSSYLLDEDEML